jgi:hypothetical protein
MNLFWLTQVSTSFALLTPLRLQVQVALLPLLSPLRHPCVEHSVVVIVSGKELKIFFKYNL